MSQASSAALTSPSGSMVVNSWFSQFLADITATPLARPSNLETTAIGAATLAGMSAGVLSDLSDARQLNAPERTFAPDMAPEERERLLSGWDKAVERALL